MNTAVTQCPRCGGAAGAHFAFCFVAQAWERFMGPGFPWAPQQAETTFTAAEVQEIVQNALNAQHEPDIPLPPEPPEEEPDRHDFLRPEDWDDDAGLPPFRRPKADPGVFEDFLVGSGAIESDAEWMPDDHYWEEWHYARQLDLDDVHVEAAYTELADGYLDALIAEQESAKPSRTYNTEGLDKARQERRQALEDAAVQFVYDCCDFTPGGRVPLADLHDRYGEWHRADGKPSMSKDKLRSLLVELGLPVEEGRLPEMRASGRAPLLVHGVTMRAVPVETPLPPKLVVVPERKQPPQKHALIGAKPGGELHKQVRDLIEPLITEQKWEYQPHNKSGKGRPRLYTPAGKAVTLPSTPHLNGHTLENTRSFLKANGAVL